MFSAFYRQPRLLLFLGFALFVVASVIIQNLGFNNRVFELFRGLPHFDKVGHFLLMGGFNFLAVLAIAPRLQFQKLPATLWVSTVVTILVALEELSQGLVANRSLSALDFFASLFGVTVFGFLAHLLVRQKRGTISP